MWFTGRVLALVGAVAEGIGAESLMGEEGNSEADGIVAVCGLDGLLYSKDVALGSQRALDNRLLVIDSPRAISALAKPVLVFLSRLDHDTDGVCVCFPGWRRRVHLLEKPGGLGEGAGYEERALAGSAVRDCVRYGMWLRHGEGVGRLLFARRS